MSGMAHTDSGRVPESQADWERALTRHFLMIGAAGDASPITSFEVTPATLAEAGSFTGEGAADRAVASFKRRVCGYGLRDALEHDWAPSGFATDDAPGYFAYLCLTLFIASKPDEDMQLGGDFHDKLRRFLGVDSGYRALPGVAKKWRSLAAWLDQRRTAGLPFRRLVLPDYPKSWVHIGLTRKLAFPAKADATLLRHFLAQAPGILSRPLAFIHKFEAFLAGAQRASDGMIESFEDFKAARLSGDRFLAQHPFWRLAAFCAPSEAGSETREAQVLCSFDEDGAPQFSAVLLGGAALTSPPGTLSDAVASLGRSEARSPSTLRYGLLAFQQAGYGEWRSTSSLDVAAGAVLLGVSPQAHARLRAHRTLFVSSGEWLISVRPLARATADECASLAGIASSPEEGLAAVSVIGGVRTGAMFLGRPAFLPCIAASAAAGRTRPGAGAHGDLVAEAAGGDMLRLRSTRPVGGPWFVDPAVGRAWSRCITFAEDAFVHEHLDSAAFQYAPAKDWAGSKDKASLYTQVRAGWSDDPGPLDDLVEAIYAGGRAGWDEAALVPLIQGAFGSKASPFTILRLLREAAILDPRLRPQWRGRVWTLRPPAIRLLDRIGIVEGAVGKRLADEFEHAGRTAGAKPFRIPGGREPMAAALLGCCAEGVRETARRLGWPVLEGAGRPNGRLAFEPTKLVILGHKAASRWDWTARKFIADGHEGTGPVGLTRWSQPGAREQDIYTVDDQRNGRRRTLLSRTAAVLLAHSWAGMPLFEARDGFLVGSVGEAHLPDKLASWLRLKHAANAGVIGGLRVYRADEDDAAWLVKLLPAVVNLYSARHSKTEVELLSLARHSHGRIRLAWIGGRLAPVPGHAFSEER